MATSIREHSVSLTTLPSLKPSLSTTGPPRTDARIPPMAMTPAVIPTLAALPVVTRTNHGSANVVMLLPIEEIRLAPNMEKDWPASHDRRLLLSTARLVSHLGATAKQTRARRG